MRFSLTILLTAGLASLAFSQSSIEAALERFNKNSVDYITVGELQHLEKPILLDTRKREEFEISHLKDAVWVGHKSFQIDSILKKYPDKSTPLVAYCSIGVRSENIGEKLLKAGYTDVKNLYGGIFEWVNHENPVFDSKNQETKQIHAFDKQWGKLLTKGKKVYKSKSPKD